MERAAQATMAAAALFLAGVAGPVLAGVAGPADLGPAPAPAASVPAWAVPARAVPARAVPAGAPSPGRSPGLRARSGPSWTVTKAPLPHGAGAGAVATLSGVSCPSALVCLAVGDFIDSSGRAQGLLLASRGPAWSATEAPLPAGAAAPGAEGPAVTLGSVACPSVSACVAVGGYTDASGHQQALLLATRGSSWTATRAPLPGGAAANPDAYLPEVSCPSITTCVAVGGYTDASGHQQALLLATRGSSWTATRAPLPGGATARAAASLSDVTCPSAARCAAAGMYTNASGEAQGLLLASRGSSWTATRAPLPAGAAGGWLAAVACPSAATCVAAGNYVTSLDVGYGLLLTTRGSSWAAAQAPRPPGAAVSADANLPGHDVVCPSASTCVAAGSYHSVSGSMQGLLLAGPTAATRGSSWTATRAPLPTGATAGWLASVACPSTATCVATGQYDDSSGNWQGLLLASRGSSWTATTAPLPAGAATSPNPWLPSVACASAAACVAAGYYTDSAGYPQAMLLTRTG